jgi:hypothetical protein
MAVAMDGQTDRVIQAVAVAVQAVPLVLVAVLESLFFDININKEKHHGTLCKN